jgi:hypothetical protein
MVPNFTPKAKQAKTSVVEFLYHLSKYIDLRKNRFIKIRDIPCGKRKMNPKSNKPKLIDILSLSDAEKIEFFKETRKKLKQQLEEARFWRTFIENEQTLLKSVSSAFERSTLSTFEQDNFNNFS